MTLESSSGDETREDSLRDNCDPQIHEALKAVWDEPRQPRRPTVSLTENDKSVPGGFGYSAAGRIASTSEGSPQARTVAARNLARIAIKSKGKILFIDAKDVIAVEAKGNYSQLLQTSSSHMLHESISTVEQKLHLYGFLRIHRSVLVNAALVEEIQPWSTGEYVLRLKGGREYTVTRTYKRNLGLLAQSWIGMESSFIE